MQKYLIINKKTKKMAVDYSIGFGIGVKINSFPSDSNLSDDATRWQDGFTEDIAKYLDGLLANTNYGYIVIGNTYVEDSEWYIVLTEPVDFVKDIAAFSESCIELLTFLRNNKVDFDEDLGIRLVGGLHVR